MTPGFNLGGPHSPGASHRGDYASGQISKQCPTNLGAAGQIGSYSNGVPMDVVARKIKDVVAHRSGLEDPALSDLLCQRLHLAPLRFGPDAAWPDRHPIGTHAKFWMVDDRLFYVGSENLYPSDLQEFGYVVDNAKAAAEIKKAYWDEVWKWSRLAAISGADAPRCVFKANAATEAAVSRRIHAHHQRRPRRRQPPGRGGGLAPRSALPRAGRRFLVPFVQSESIR